MKNQNYTEIYPMIHQPDIRNKIYRFFKGFLRHLWPAEGAVLEETVIIYYEDLYCSSWHVVG